MRVMYLCFIGRTIRATPKMMDSGLLKATEGIRHSIEATLVCFESDSLGASSCSISSSPIDGCLFFM